MRIAHIIWALETGGAETMLVDIINEQVKSQEVALLVVNDLYNVKLLKKIDSRCKVKLFRRRIGSKSLIPWLMVNLFLWRCRPDIVHFHLEGMRKMVFYPVPKVFTIHNMHTSGVEYSRFAALYSISDAVRRKTKAQGFDSQTIWNGIYSNKVLARQTPSNMDLPHFNIVCVGRLYTPHKGQDLLVRALSILKNKGLNNFHLDIIGEGTSRSELENLVSELDLQDYITFAGQKDRDYLYKHICCYDLFVLPSRSEGFGLSVAEAMCAKVPVLISDLDGPMEVIDNGNLGLHFKSEDVEDLAAKIELFFNGGIKYDVIEAAYEFACEHFDIRKVAEKYITEYRKILVNK